jgi:hypothetical protein
VGKEVVITSNDATLTITNPGFVPDTTTKYIIMDTLVLQPQEHLQHLLIPQKTWAVNKWAGKKIVYTSGTTKNSFISQIQ